MSEVVYKTFAKVLQNLKEEDNVKSIIHVGSSKDIIYQENAEINDIDLFVIVDKQEEDQIREDKYINSIEFDINYISIKGAKKFIENKEFFFLKIKDGNLLYDKDNIGKGILFLCEEKYNEGPDKISLEEKTLQINQIFSDISRLNKKKNYEAFEYDFLIYMYLLKLVKLYYIVNDKWIPKDKKLLKSLKEDDSEFYNLVCSVKGNNKYDNLLKIKDYIISKLKTY